MNKLLISLLFAGLLVANVNAQTKIPHTHKLTKERHAYRTQIVIPQVNGYNCYKGDFHVHTSYSDGVVNPDGRVVEAWYDGLDILAITDHYESQAGVRKFFKVTAPYNADGKPTKYTKANAENPLRVDFNAIHQEAVNMAKKKGYPLLLIKGCEMARNTKSHGHFNALFVQDINTLFNPDMAEAFRNVKKQGGIVIHNHPAWRRDTSDKTEFHEQVYGEGLVDGVEVINGNSFYPHIVRRCIDEKLAMFANTDIHSVSSSGYDWHGFHRTMTLVFAKECTEQAIKDAILKRRTIAYSKGNLVGEEEWLSGLFNASVDCRLIGEDKEKNTRTFLLVNQSSITYKLRRGKTICNLEPFKTMTFSFGKDKKTGKYIAPKFVVENMWIADYKHPTIEIKIDK